MEYEKVAFFAVIFCCGFLPSIAADYHHKGCFAYREPLENTHNVIIEDPLLTPKRCLTKCSKISAQYFFVRSGQICVCVSAIHSFTNYGESNECTSPCKGDNQQLCGGELAIDIYKVSLCTHFTNPAYGYVNQTTDTAWFGCAEGYQLQGPNIAHCNKTVYEWNEPVLPRCVKGKGPCAIPGWFIGLFIVFVVLALMFFGGTLFLRGELETMKLVLKKLPENNDVHARESGVGYSVPVLDPPMYAKPNLEVEEDAHKAPDLKLIEMSTS